jgi:hypothetical protein
MFEASSQPGASPGQNVYCTRCTSPINATRKPLRSWR